MTILVTGASGFVGKHLLRYLSDRSSDKIIAVGGIRSNLPKVDHSVSQVLWKSVDLTDEKAVDQLLIQTQPDEVYHLAGIAITFGVDPNLYHRVNVMGTYNLGRSILRNCKSGTKILYVSSAAVYGPSRSSEQSLDESAPIRPKNDYGASKAAGEMVLWPFWRQGLDIRVVRPFNHTGPGQQNGFVCPDLISRLRMALQKSKSEGSAPRLTVKQMSSVRDFTDVRDIVRAYVDIMKHFKSGEVVNVASGKGISMFEVIKMLCDKVAKVKGLDIVTEDSSECSSLSDALVGDATLLFSRTGWVPKIQFEQTLMDMWMMDGDK